MLAGAITAAHHRRPGFDVGRARAHQVHLEGVAIGPVERMQVLDGAAGLIADDANEFDQRRSGAHLERFRDVGRRQPGADALAGMLDLHARAFQELKQRPRGQFLAGERHRDAFGNVRRQIGERHAVDGAHANRSLQHLIRPDAKRLRDRTVRRHIVERKELDRRAPPHVGEIGEHAGNIRGNRRRRRPINHPRSGAAAPLDQPFARKLAERAPHGNARHAVIFGQLVLGRQLGAEAEGAAEDAVAQDEVDLLRLCLAEPIAQAALPLRCRPAAAALLGIL